MKILNRPMFRYGGPIKEGIMDGIQEPKRGRVDGPGSYAGEEAAKAFQGIYSNEDFRQRDKFRRMDNTDFTTPQSIKNSFLKKNYADTTDVIPSSADDGMTDYLTPVISDRAYDKRTQIMQSPEAEKAYLNNYSVDSGMEEKMNLQKINLKKFDPERYEQVYGKSDLEAAALLPKVNEVIEKKEVIEENPEGNRKKSINNILEKLGYARSQKNALYDALIAGGQRISREGLGKTNLVNDLIADTSTAYDKPEKIREAAELMQVQQDLKLEGIAASKTNAMEEQYNFLVGKVGKDRATAIITKGDGNSDDAFLRLKGLKNVTTNEAVLGAVRTMIENGEAGIKEGDVKGEISKKQYKDGIQSFKNSSEFNSPDKGAGVYVYEGIVVQINGDGTHEVIKTFGSINDKAKKWLGIF